ncbi:MULTISPECIES: hypothetical protein [Paenibacillus]|uniref:hypothetical protein n=1 Tax=Paenibacillus TaxID=44249 RepID=UPI0022B89B76|nr:hypothetical protein [Paenibacillus caseinilyticus]MCZ8520430.1 hypothetical protein [Paenibacillus caseinilyticus]
MLQESIMNKVRLESKEGLNLPLEHLDRLADYSPFVIHAPKEPAYVLFRSHPESYTAPIVKEGGRRVIDCSRLRPVGKLENDLLQSMYRHRIYTLYAFAFMFTYEDKGLILLWSQQLEDPPAFNRAQTNALLEEALGPEGDSSYFTLSRIFHPAQLIEIAHENQTISTAVGGHSFIMIIPVEKKWTLSLRKSKKPPADDFDLLRRQLAVYKDEAVYLQRYFQETGLWTEPASL